MFARSLSWGFWLHLTYLEQFSQILLQNIKCSMDKECSQQSELYKFFREKGNAFTALETLTRRFQNMNDSHEIELIEILRDYRIGDEYQFEEKNGKFRIKTKLIKDKDQLEQYFIEKVMFEEDQIFFQSAYQEMNSDIQKLEFEDKLLRFQNKQDDTKQKIFYIYQEPIFENCNQAKEFKLWLKKLDIKKETEVQQQKDTVQVKEKIKNKQRNIKVQNDWIPGLKEALNQ
ncbi:hypothetical protein pb186bvf_017762 [Paramecium bursaria]